jgi:hypothetical protein
MLTLSLRALDFQEMEEIEGGSWWTSWGKCVAGTLGGAITVGLGGAAAGSAVPVLGTAAGAVVGVIGGALGGAAASCWLNLPLLRHIKNAGEGVIKLVNLFKTHIKMEPTKNQIIAILIFNLILLSVSIWGLIKWIGVSNIRLGACLFCSLVLLTFVVLILKTHYKSIFG